MFRRGPSAWYHVIAWDTARDTFDHGAWFRGRIYEDRCDLSPDGALLLYFALQGRRWNTAYRGSWTAISRPPWLYALTLWPHGSTWGGGGYFWDDRSVVLQGGSGTHPDHPVNGVKVVEGPRRRARPAPCVPEAEWSGHDQGGYPVFAAAGKLYRRLPRGDKELADFNGLTPDPVEAPAWAKVPVLAPGGRARGRRGGRARR